MRRNKIKKFIKDWWFSILMYVCALAICIYVVIGSFLWFWDDDYAFVLLEINTLSPVLLLIIIGVANQPRKENKDEKKDY